MRQAIHDENEDKRRRRSSSYMDSKLRRSQAHPHQFGEPVCCICHHRLHSERRRRRRRKEEAAKETTTKLLPILPFPTTMLRRGEHAGINLMKRSNPMT